MGEIMSDKSKLEPQIAAPKPYQKPTLTKGPVLTNVTAAKTVSGVSPWWVAPFGKPDLRRLIVRSWRRSGEPAIHRKLRSWGEGSSLAPGEMASASDVATAADKNSPVRALFLVDPGAIPARVIWAWLESGHEIAEVWSSVAPGRSVWKRTRRIGWIAPRWSLTAAISKWHLPHRHIANLKDHSEAVDLINALGVDVVVSVHFMRILPAALLSRMSMPVLNLHPSLLPAYRGPTPLVAMILDEAQDRFGGVTLHQIVPAVDAGPIFASRNVPFPADRNLRRWELDLARAAAALAVDAIPKIVAGRLGGVEQDEEKACYRRAMADELKLTPTHSTRRIAWLCSTIGRLRPPFMAIADRAYAVTGIARHVGPRSGQPPRIGWWTIETDVADGRVRLRRKPLWEGRRRRIETWLLQVLSPE
jgi:methionyl-tRNA formyltransferase